MSFRVCRHIKTDGLQCKSPAMRQDKFCYYHTTLRRPHQSLSSKPDISTMRPTYDSDGKFKGMQPLAAPCGSIELGLLEDSASVQVAISTVVNALATNRLEVRRATALLYGLQLAANNFRNMYKEVPPFPERMLRVAMDDSNGEPIALPGLNSDRVWTYADDPLELYKKEEAEVRLYHAAKAAADNSPADDPQGSVDGDPSPNDDPTPENCEQQDEEANAGDTSDAAEEELDRDDEVDEDDEGEEDEPGDESYGDDGDEDDPDGDYDDEFDEAACERAFSDFRERVREALAPEMKRIRKLTGGSVTTAFS